MCEALSFKIGGSDGWKAKHAKVRQESCILDNSERWSTGHALRGVPATAERIRDCIDLAHQLALQKHPDCPVQNLVVDVSQDGSRMAWCTHMRSITRSSAFYSFGADRLLCAQETLGCLGFPPLNWGEFSEAQIKDVAGETFAVPCAATCLLVLASLLPELWSDHPFSD